MFHNFIYTPVILMSMKYCFTAKGHENILATHKKTLEFTKDERLSLDGDCIVGVSADFTIEGLRKMLAIHTRMRMRISAGGASDEVEFVSNKDFSSDRELVIRFSEFGSDRTFGFSANKAAAQLNKELIKQLRIPGNVINVEIMPLIKVVIFDFDDTIEELKKALDYAHVEVAKRNLEKYKVPGERTVRLLEDIDRSYCSRAFHREPRMFDRHLWFRDYFHTLRIQVAEQEIDEMVKFYWQKVNTAAKPMPFSEEVLSKLKEDFVIAVISDSDGGLEIKQERVRNTGLSRFIDFMVTGDEFGINKPDQKFYDAVFSRFGVRADECVMVGDKPQVDLELAKKLGMKTVWMKHGRWAAANVGRRFDYVDYEITNMLQILDVIKVV
jgi:HAD superfamily hydrolase (TIGR01509 family)